MWQTTSNPVTSWSGGARTRSRGLWLVLLVALGACNGAAKPSEPAAAAPTPAPSAPAPQPAAAPTEIRVAAASDLTRAFEDLGQRFEASTKQKVSFSFGSSGLLTKQLKEGAPFDMFAAANVAFVDELVTAGACDGASKAPYARGRIVVWSKPGLVQPVAALGDLTDKRFKHIAIANPEHAPYGAAAKAALEKLGIWSKLEPRIVYGENIKQTQQFAESGNAEAAIIALSLVIGDGSKYLLIDDTLHPPIDQALVACNHGPNAAGGRAFAAFVNSADGRALMRKYGFVLPGEALAATP